MEISLVRFYSPDNLRAALTILLFQERDAPIGAFSLVSIMLSIHRHAP
jgi:hypothetical protein